MAYSKLSQSDEDYLLIAAVDFGTTYSGYAFTVMPSVLTSSDEKVTDIRMNKNWGSEMSQTSYKAPTCVLTGPDKSFKSFGYKAEHEYSSLVGENEAGSYNLYRQFKMVLLQQNKLSERTKIQSTTGHLALAIDIFAMVLKYLTGHLLEAVKESKISAIDNSKIKWVLTVPAIWKDSAKGFMRQACIKAGMITHSNPSQLVIALEPEAASVFCRNVAFDQIKDGSKDLSFKSGQKYLVIDAGGGTVDITAHKILPSGNVKEILPPSGGPWGGKCIDEAYEALLKQIFGEKFINHYKITQPRDWLLMILAFERSKASIKASEGTNLNINMSWAFGTYYWNFSKIGMDETIQRKGSLGVSFRNGALSISHEAAISLFEPVINNITGHLQELLNEYGNHIFNYVMLVGGFGQCNLLQNAVSEVFAGKSKMIIPLEAQLAIVKGAVMYGHNPSNIQSRIAKHSYGYNVSRPFIDGIHNPRYLDNFGAQRWCTDLFKSIIKKGDEIHIGTAIEHNVGSNNRITTEVEFYRANKQHVTYANEPGVTKLGEISIKHEETFPINKKIKIITTFGGTELLVKAKDVESGREYDAYINYLN